MHHEPIVALEGRQPSLSCTGGQKKWQEEEYRKRTFRVREGASEQMGDAGAPLPPVKLPWACSATTSLPQKKPRLGWALEREAADIPAVNPTGLAERVFPKVWFVSAALLTRFTVKVLVTVGRGSGHGTGKDLPERRPV